MATPLSSTEREGGDHIAKVSYTHDAMVDYILQKPQASQEELALYFGYGQPWISTIVNSDSFKARLAERKSELVDPIIRQELESRFEILAHQSLDVIQKKLLATQSADLATKALELTTKALGFGARDRSVAIQNNFVVALPPKSENQDDWAAQARKSAQRQHFTQATDVTVKEVQDGQL
jgi:hypothetical protein